MTRILISCTTEDEAGEPRLTVLTRVFCCEAERDRLIAISAERLVQAADEQAAGRARRRLVEALARWQ